MTKSVALVWVGRGQVQQDWRIRALWETVVVLGCGAVEVVASDQKEEHIR